MLNLSESLDKLEQLIEDTDDAELAELLRDVLHVYDDVERESDDEDEDDDEPSTENIDDEVDD